MLSRRAEPKQRERTKANLISQEINAIFVAELVTGSSIVGIETKDMVDDPMCP